MNKQITVVFPMGGKAQRFGNKFKPFLKIFDKTFIELALEPFLKQSHAIREIIFIVTKEQCKEFNVTQRIRSFNISAPTRVLDIDPAESVAEALHSLFTNRTEINDIIFCDCDHTLNVDDIFKAIQEDKNDVIIPGWGIDPSQVKSWSIASVGNSIVSSIKEKAYPDPIENEEYFGVIGCYYFRKFLKPSDKCKYISDIIQERLESGNSVKLVPIHEAEFFGDPQRLKQLYEEKRASTVFLDIDGTIIEHENEPNYTSIKLLEGARDKVLKWRQESCFIILTTSRDEQFRPEMEKLLREFGIRYEAMVMGLPSGARYLINDKKPYSDRPMAHAYQVERNVGIRDINLDYQFEPQGESFAEFTKDGDKAYKHLPKNSSTYQLKKFEAQFKSMRAVSQNTETASLVPKIYDFSDYSYSMEYLDGYVGLHKIEDKVPVLEQLFKKLPKLYATPFKAPIDWLKNYLEEKIYAKKQVIAELGLDATEVYECLESMSIDEYDFLSPTHLVNTIHGDLTYENIMCSNWWTHKNGVLNKTGDYSIKLLDFDNDGVPQPIEMDLGKLYQSCVCGYEMWETEGEETHASMKEFQVITDFYRESLGISADDVTKKGYFYCGLHLMRMLPYQAKTSISRAEKALKYAKELLLK